MVRGLQRLQRESGEQRGGGRGEGGRRGRYSLKGMRLWGHKRKEGVPGAEEEEGHGLGPRHTGRRVIEW